MLTAADARTNTSSANYKAGYNAGKAAGTISIPKLWCRAGGGDNRFADGDYSISISGGWGGG